MSGALVILRAGNVQKCAHGGGKTEERRHRALIEEHSFDMEAKNSMQFGDIASTGGGHKDVNWRIFCFCLGGIISSWGVPSKQSNVLCAWLMENHR